MNGRRRSSRIQTFISNETFLKLLSAVQICIDFYRRARVERIEGSQDGEDRIEYTIKGCGESYMKGTRNIISANSDKQQEVDKVPLLLSG